MRNWLQLLTVVIVFIIAIAGCKQKILVDEKEDFGCFPSSCSSIQDANGQKMCKDWKANKKVEWPSDCNYLPTEECRKLCNFEKSSAVSTQKIQSQKDITSVDDMSQSALLELCKKYPLPPDCSIVPEPDRKLFCERCKEIFPQELNATQWQQPQLPQQNQTPPIIKNLGVSFEPWDKNTNRAGVFLFKKSERKVFLEFGAKVPDGKDGTKILPHFTYLTAPDAEVYAVADGIITEVRYQDDTKDYEITIKSEPFSAWFISLDHVTDLKVSEGKSVKAGDIIGKVGPWINGLGLIEIMVVKSVRKEGFGPDVATYNYCPFKYFDPSLLQAYKEKVAKHMKDWEDFKGDTRIYDEEKDIYPGCPYDVLVEEIETGNVKTT